MNEMVDHTITHFEIPADDVDRLRKFYSSLFGWVFEEAPGQDSYWMIQTVPIGEKGSPTGAGVNGGLKKRTLPDEGVTNYISVESVDEYCTQVVELGGEVVVPKQEVLFMGWFALVADPEGNRFAIWQDVD